MTDLWSAIRSIYELSITSGTEFARANHASTVDDIRAMLLSAPHAYGWAGLESIAAEALTSLGTLHRFDAGVITQDEHMYVHQFICHVLVGVLYGHSDFPVSPGVLQDISSDFARTGHFPSVITPLPPFSDDTGTTDNLFTSMITTTATLVIALVRHIDDGNPDISHAFHQFAQNPALWSQFIQPHHPLSIEDIVHLVHIRALNTASRPSDGSHTEGMHSPFVIGILGFFDIRIWSDGNTTDIDIEAGIGGFILRDGEVEYLAALFVAALIRFHAGPGVNTSRHAG